ncbi:MAG: MFS transporter [Actinobacteria bacterium]|nr:MFS transporter [Actinomycetota bacterium]
MTGPRSEPVAGPVPVPVTRLDKSGWVVLGTLMLATVLANIASVCLFPQIVSLSEEFGRPVNQVVWSMIGFHVIAAGVGGVAAALGATIGNRRMLSIVLFLLFVGSLMSALSSDLPLLVAGRVIQGVSMAIQALSIGVIAVYWRGEAMRRAMSMVVLSMGLGAVLAYLLSGFIWRSGGDWRTLFWILGAASAIDVILTLLFIKETPRTKGVRIDYMGCIGLVAWTVLLLLPLSQANSWGWGSTKLLSILLPGVAVLILWVVWELRRKAPLIDLRILKKMGAWQGVIIWLALSLGLLIPATSMPYLFQTPPSAGFGFGQSMFVVSLALAAPAAVMCVTSSLATPIMRRLGAKGTMLLGMVFGLAGFGLAFAHGSMWLTIVWMAATGVPAALAGSASYSVAAEAVAPEQGILLGTIYNVSAGTGCSIASALVGYVLSLRLVAVEITTPDGVQTQLFPADETFTWSALIVGGMAVIGLAAIMTIRSGHLRAAAHRSDLAGASKTQS